MEPERTCIGCRNRDLQSRMIRLVRIGDEIVDATRPRLPGRGAYLHAGCLRVAEKRQALRRAFGPGALLTGSLRTRLSQILPVGI